MARKLSRRQLLRAGAFTAASVALAACEPQVIKETVEVEKIVKETVEVQVEKEVTTVVEKEVTKVVEKEVTSVVEAACKMDWTPTLPPAPVKFDPPLEITCIFPSDSKFLYKDTYQNNPMYNRVLDTLGLKYNIHWQASGDVWTQKFTTDIASGTLPDMFYPSDPTQMADFVANDVVEDIKDIWEATASDLTKAKKKYPDDKSWTVCKSGDKLFGIAFLNGPSSNSDHIVWVRKDLMDKQGITDITTIEEAEAYMLKNIQSGDCKSGVMCHSWGIPWDINPVFGAYGAMPYSWLKSADGNSLEWGAVQPACKPALAKLAEWYKNGILDPDFYSKGPNLGDVSLVFTAWYYAQGEWPRLEKDNPGMDWTFLPHYIKGPEGKFGRRDSDDHGKCFCFKKGTDPKKIEAVIQELNWAIERHVNWTKYQQYGEYANATAFAEGYEWMFDENCELKAGPIDNMWPYTFTVGGSGWPYVCYPDYQKDIYSDMAPWFDADPATLNKAQRYLTQNKYVKDGIDAYLYTVDSQEGVMDSKFIGVAGPAKIKYWGDLGALLEESFWAIVLGNKPVDSFDDFVATWKKQGGDEVTAEVNEWWATHKS
ncbi:MAG: extracellular solute-binding protein [Chloroflexi bacterium]|nr:extracellular solute-binding protein [Chloroflexota bacterium]